MARRKKTDEGIGFIDGIDIFPLEVLDQLRRQNIFTRLDVPSDIGRDLGQTELPAGKISSFPEDEEVFMGSVPPLKAD